MSRFKEGLVTESVYLPYRRNKGHAPFVRRSTLTLRLPPSPSISLPSSCPPFPPQALKKVAPPSAASWTRRWRVGSRTGGSWWGGSAKEGRLRCTRRCS